VEVMSISIYEKTTTLILLELQLVHHFIENTDIYIYILLILHSSGTAGIGPVYSLVLLSLFLCRTLNLLL
jgi:hypothetical protein